MGTPVNAATQGTKDTVNYARQGNIRRAYDSGHWIGHMFGMNLDAPTAKPPTPAPPPPPPDEAGAMLREISRAATQRELARSKGRTAAFSTGGDAGMSGGRSTTGGF